jgi:hypothetical protein
MTARTYDSVTETDYDTFLVQDFSVYPPVYRLVEEPKKSSRSWYGPTRARHVVRCARPRLEMMRLVDKLKTTDLS